MEMTYALPWGARTSDAFSLATNTRDFCGTGSPVPVNYLGLFRESSRPAALDVTDFCILVVQDIANNIDLTQSIANSFDTWRSGPRKPSVPSGYTFWLTHAFAPNAGFAVMHRERVDDAITYFSLNTSQAAEVFAVSRPTIYGWRQGQPVRDHAKRERVEQIVALASFWRKFSSAPVGDGLNWKNPVTGQTLLMLLSAQPLDMAGTETHLQTLHEALRAFWARSNTLTSSNAADGFAPMPERWRRETRRRSASANALRAKPNDF